MQCADKNLLIVQFESLREITAGSVSDSVPITFFIEMVPRGDYQDRILHPDFFSVYLITGGTGIHVIGDQRHDARSGDVFVMHQGMSHYFEKCTRLHMTAIHFQSSLFSAETWRTLRALQGFPEILLSHAAHGGEKWLRLAPSSLAEVGAMLHLFADEWQYEGPDQDLMAKTHFLSILVYLARCHRSVGALPPSTPVSQVKAQIESRYGDTLHISDLAASCYLSQRRLTEVFRHEVGCSPRDYLGMVRIEAAKRLLRNTDMLIAEVAAKAGFPDAAYFARFFNKHVGLSPSVFREERRSLSWLLSNSDQQA